MVPEDLADRGIESGELVPGAQLLSRTELPALFAEYAVVSHWKHQGLSRDKCLSRRVFLTPEA